MCVFVRVITRVICCLIYVRMKHSGGAGATDGRGRLSPRGVFVLFFCLVCLELPKWTQPDKKNDGVPSNLA